MAPRRSARRWSRLAAEGLVVLEGQKGFSVPPVTRAHLHDITRSRQLVEPEALRLAMQAWRRGLGGRASSASLSLMRREIERRRCRQPGLARPL
jgi:GntR family carbon starvation induced transcriptional regulator